MNTYLHHINKHKVHTVNVGVFKAYKFFINSCLFFMTWKVQPEFNIFYIKLDNFLSLAQEEEA